MPHAHRREHIRLGGYAREQRFFGQVDKLNSLLAGYGWKPLEKLLKRGISLDVIDQSLDGHASATETRRAAHASGINPNNLIQSRLLLCRHNLTLTPIT